MTKTYTFTCSARRVGAIGVQHLAFLDVDADTYEEAREKAFNPEHNGGWEYMSGEMRVTRIDGVTAAVHNAAMRVELDQRSGIPSLNQWPEKNVFVWCEVDGFMGPTHASLRWDGERWWRRDGKPFGSHVYGFDDQLPPETRSYTPEQEG